MVKWKFIVKPSLAEAKAYVESLDTTTDIASVFGFMVGGYQVVVCVHM